ncbi:MAG: hypothetical protein HQK52_12570 [Oligoflexia bacterium]|nr:hypothetical protein [Oligoflexia bacterium]
MKSYSAKNGNNFVGTGIGIMLFALLLCCDVSANSGRITSVSNIGSDWPHPTMTFSYVPEMMPLSPFDPISIEESDPITTPALKRNLEREMIRSVLDQIDDKKIIEISRWATSEMQDYHYNPNRETDSSSLRMQYLGNKDQMLLYELTLDTLPSHHDLVTRWLKAYLYTNATTPWDSVSVIITIRGERQE